ncbi:MAG: hypothetical protein R3B47_11880 [Bacteroidia bacterium]
MDRLHDNFPQQLTPCLWHFPNKTARLVIGQVATELEVPGAALLEDFSGKKGETKTLICPGSTCQR